MALHQNSIFYFISKSFLQFQKKVHPKALDSSQLRENVLSENDKQEHKWLRKRQVAPVSDTAHGRLIL